LADEIEKHSDTIWRSPQAEAKLLPGKIRYWAEKQHGTAIVKPIPYEWKYEEGLSITLPIYIDD
jgi:hypothetical protein